MKKLLVFTLILTISVDAFTQGPPLPVVYTFIGNGDWNNPANWLNNSKPPEVITPDIEIIISPIDGGECVLSQTLTIPVGAKLTVKQGAVFKSQFITVVTPTPTVYVSSKWWYGSPPVTGKLHAIDANTGAIKWISETANSSPVYSTPAYASDIVYANLGSEIVALNAFNGTRKWSFTPGEAPMGTPCIVDGKVFFNSNDEKLYALDATTGALLWTFSQRPISGFLNNYSNPTVVNNLVYFGSIDKYVYAVNATNGSLIWEEYNDHINGASGFYSSPCVINDVLYIVDLNRSVIALNTSDGSEKWKVNIQSGALSSPTVVSGTLYVGSYNNSLYALDALTGTQRWKFTTSSQINGSPIVDNGTVYLTASGTGLFALDAVTGTQKWRAENSSAIHGSPVVFNGTVFYGVGMYFRARDASTGVMKWQITAPSDMNTFAYTSPIVVDVNNNVYYPSVSGNKQ